MTQITIKNNPSILNKLIDSLKNQTYKKFDIIVVNDGYKDFEKIKIIYGQTLNIIELQHSNSSAKNREYGINYCIDQKYDILIFGDSEFLKEVDIIVNDLSLFEKNGIYEEKYLSHRVKNLDAVDLEFIKNKNIFGMTNTAINLNKISKVSFDNKIVAVDWYFFKILLEQGLKSIFTNEMVTYYRQYENNTVGLSVEDNKYYLWWEKR